MAATNNNLLAAVAAAMAVACLFAAGSSFVVPSTARAGGFLHARPLASAQSTDAAFGSSLAPVVVGSLLVAVGAACRRRATARRAEGPDATAEDIPRPENLLESPKFPMFVGSTRGYFSQSTRERHAITWTAKAEAEFEMPIGGWAIMNKGENLCYFRRKEQCIALGKQLRKMKIENYKIYRISKDGEVTFMHPADGVFPEKVNKGRIQVNGRPFTVCQNPQMASVKWTKYHMRPYEADPLTTLFIRAKMQAFADEENLFPIPNYGEKVYGEDAEKLIEATQRVMSAKSV